MSYKDQWFAGTRNCIKVVELLTKSIVASFRRVFPTMRDVLLIYIHHSVLHVTHAVILSVNIQPLA